MANQPSKTGKTPDHTRRPNTKLPGILKPGAAPAAAPKVKVLAAPSAPAPKPVS